MYSFKILDNGLIALYCNNIKYASLFYSKKLVDDLIKDDFRQIKILRG